MALPAPVRTFLKTHDLTGKTIVPFITHGGYGPGARLKRRPPFPPARGS
ncbi:flavodoxin [Allgaiera indica]